MRPVGRRNAPAWLPPAPKSPLRVIRAVVVRGAAQAWRGVVSLPRLLKQVEEVVTRPGPRVAQVSARLGVAALRRGRVLWRRAVRYLSGAVYKGEIRVQNVTGEIRVQNVTGEIRVQNVTGEIRVQNVTGEICVQNVTGGITE